MGKIISEMIIFGALGLGFEVIFTGALDYFKHRKSHLFGFSSLWYFPLYAIIPVFFHFAFPVLFLFSWYIRGLIYAAVFHLVEYISMGMLRIFLGASPSEKSYYKSKWHIHGLTRIDFAPAFFVAGLLFEKSFLFIN